MKNNNLCLRFRVSGLIHKGLVFIRLNGNDYFDVATTNFDGVVKEENTDVPVDCLLQVLDHMIEKR